MSDNRLTADSLAKLSAGDAVAALTWLGGWTHPEVTSGRVVRLTKTQIVVEHHSSRGPYEQRFRRDDGRRTGDSSSTNHSELIDPTHPTSVRQIAAAKRRRRQAAIDSLSHRWSRDRDDLDVLRRLHVAVGEYLDAEDQS